MVDYFNQHFFLSITYRLKEFERERRLLKRDQRKKQKEEKIQLFGQCTFDLLSLLKGATEISLKLPVHPVPGSYLETLPSDSPLV